MRRFAFTFDFEASYSGCVGQYEIFHDREKIEHILSILRPLDVKMTVFVVAEIFKLYPEIVRIFERYNCEFEVHSYSHNVVNQDLEYEITKAKTAYFDYFKKYPSGYRAPLGKISLDTIKLLEKHGFLYDSSIFPSYYPNPLRYIFRNRKVHYFGNTNIMEIPITSITPFRLTLSLSYVKLLGINSYLKLLRIFNPPDFICFSSHLHDFIVSDNAYSKLPPFWKFIYGRNMFSGIDFCVAFLKYIKRKGYKFCFLSEIYELCKRS